MAFDIQPDVATMHVELFDGFNSGQVAVRVRYDHVRMQAYDATKHYYVNGQRTALRLWRRRCAGTTCEAPIYLHGDHGSGDGAGLRRRS